MKISLFFLWKSFGFYFDLARSYECFESTKVPQERIKTVEIAKEDQETLKEKNIELTLEVSADKLLDYLRTKF